MLGLQRIKSTAKGQGKKVEGEGIVRKIRFRVIIGEKD